MTPFGMLRKTTSGKHETGLFAPVKTKGEPLVWLTGMGLALGILMIVALLAVIVINGVLAFWPKRFVAIALEEGSKAAIRGSAAIGGEIAKRQMKRVFAVDEAGNPDVRFEPEIQLHLGNREAFGFSFVFIDEADIKEKTFPMDVIRMERTDYGPAFGIPRSLATGDRVIPAESDEFGKAFDEAIARAAERRARIRHLEKDEIGRLNFELDRIAIAERRIRRAGGDPSAESPELSKQRAELEAQYQVFATEAKALRDEQESLDIMTYTIQTGEERSVPAGRLLEYYYPNRLGWAERAGLFLRRVALFLTDEPRQANMEGGIFPAIFGTAVMTLLLSLIVTPFGVIAAIYLREYAKQGPLVRSVRIAINNLAGVPSIVFGVFGLGFFVLMVGGGIDAVFFSDRLPTPTYKTGGILWCSLTLALMTVPVVIVATEESLAAVPRGSREGSLACGASQWQTIQRIVLPASAPGILTGLILAMARGAGEVAPLMLIGVVKLAPALPVDGFAPFLHLDRKFMHLGFHIFDLGFQSQDSDAARPMVFATTLFLILLVVLLNVFAITIRERLRKKYSTGAF
ncbi:MAG: phosphate ABC transporter permease PstA [Verrucomicrobiia bacterium]